MQSNATKSKKQKAQAPAKYKVGIVFINDRSTGTTIANREDGQNPMHYRYCPTLKRAQYLVNTIYGAGTNTPVISLADIYEIEKPKGTPPLARWTIEKQWNN
jgi:hypothetical protein